MTRKWRNVIIGVLVVALLGAGLWLLSRTEDNYRAKYEGTDLSTDVSGIGRSNTYDAYVASYADEAPVTEEVAVDVFSFEGDATAQAEGVLTPDESEVTWKVNVAQAGLYNIRLDYLTTASRGTDIEREILINGELPFTGASTLTFSRLWTDGGEVRKDNQGNDIRPSQKEIYDRQTAYCKDDMGYQTEPYAFHFEEGENTITLRAVNEPVVICGITLTPITKAADYVDYIAAQPEAAMTDIGDNDTSVIRGPAGKKAGRLDSYGAAQQAAAW